LRWSGVAHLLCEIFKRLRPVGLLEGNSYAFPIIQMDLADATGPSVVHVDRTIRELRAGNLIMLRKGRSPSTSRGTEEPCAVLAELCARVRSRGKGSPEESVLALGNQSWLCRSDAFNAQYAAFVRQWWIQFTRELNGCGASS